MKEPTVINKCHKKSNRSKKRLKISVWKILLAALAHSPSVRAQFPPDGKCTIQSSSTQFSLTKQANDPNKVILDNKCPSSVNSFRFSVEFTQNSVLTASPAGTALFGYHVLIGLSVAMMPGGGLNGIGFVKTDEGPPFPNLTPLIVHPLGPVGARYVVTLQITPTEAHLSIRSWRWYQKETHYNYKYTFSKADPSNLKNGFLGFFLFWNVPKHQKIYFNLLILCFRDGFYLLFCRQ